MLKNLFRNPLRQLRSIAIFWLILFAAVSAVAQQTASGLLTVDTAFTKK
jgi:hypothetical protein